MATDAKPKFDPNTEEGRDVADLWKDALKAYKGIVGFDLEKKFDSVQAMIDQGTHEMNNFHKFRHNDKKVDKLRTLFANNLEYIEKGASQLISAATPAFPPAAAIGTAITFMLGACRDQRADYDLVVVFFEDMNSFLQRTVILESRLPAHKAYQNCLMDVFTSFLTMCGYAHKYIELGRFKKWISNLLQGGDADLTGARQTMDVKLARLQNATDFAILGNTEEIKKLDLELKDNSDMHTAMLQDQKETMDSIHDTTETIRNDMAKLLKAFNDQKKEKATKPKGKVSASDQNKPASAKRIRNLLPEVEGEDHEYYILKDTIVPDTCNWVFDEPQWDEWQASEGPHPVLAITGQPGVGKSHIGASVYDKLHQEAQSDASKQTCAAHFYFREQNESLSGFYNAVVTIINQVVEQSAPICELIYIQYNKDEVVTNVNDWGDLVHNLLGHAFRKDSKNHLYLMLDGIDELEEFDHLLEFLQIIKNEELRISVVLTSRPNLLQGISDVVPTLNIEVEKEKQKDDLKELVWNRLKSLSTLRSFSRYVKQRIADKVEDSAPNMLYAEHMLLRFNTTGREAAVLRSLEKPLPADLHELYEVLVAECYRHLASNHECMVNRLLHWIAYSYRSLSLDEVASLLRVWSDDNNFDVEEIPEPFTKFIRVGDPGADAEARAKIQAQGGYGTDVSQLDKSQDANPDAIYNDGDLPVKFHERSMRSFFLEPPRKEDSRRWKASEARRQLFLDCAKILSNGDKIVVVESLKSYAVEYVFDYWREIDPQEHSAEEQIEVMEVFGAIMLNKHQFATLFDQNEVNYDGQFTEEAFAKVSVWAELLDIIKPSLSEEIGQWWSEMAHNPQNCLLHLIKAHLGRVYTAEDEDSAAASFESVKDAMQLSNMHDKLAEQAMKNFGENAGDTSEPLDKDQVAMALENLFDDVKMDASAYRAVASVLYHYENYEQAATTCTKAIERAESPLEKVKSLWTMAKVHLEMETGEAYTYANRCVENLGHDSIPPVLKREAYATKARIEAQLEKYDEALQSFTQARLSDPAGLTPGDVLEEEIGMFSEREDKTRYIEILKSWNPLERLTWMAWEYPDEYADRHDVVRDAAVQANEIEFIQSIYEESIKYLDNVNAGAPFRCELALFHWQVRDDPQMARKVLDEVLEGSSTGWPYAVTEESPNDVLDRVIGYQSDIALRLFQESSDPDVKNDLLKSLQELLSRPLALDIPPNSDTNILQQPLAIVRMQLKMGPTREAQKTLQGVINGCIDALSDNVGWNDAQCLTFLAMALNILGKISKSGKKLKRVARILLSALFSHLDLEVSHDTSDSDDGGSVSSGGSSGVASGEGSEAGDGGEHEAGTKDEVEADDEAGSQAGSEGGSQAGSQAGSANGSGSDWVSDSGSESGSEDELPTDEGDLIGNSGWRACNGACNPFQEFNYWGDRVAYQCMTCYDAFLCEDCHENRLSANKGEQLKTRLYCGKNHEYLKMPVEGWHGVEDGKIMIEGEEPLDFKEFLRLIRDELCKQAWDEFWQG
ncbi:hypothetical protein NW762_011153 [Fusarium torreyae]|uniref:Fungal STAND N-terminal Goodbye domain-containing protein n=1 Tax=Fusarium torreyae TaxID=1237075 RepID=A0A9W8RS60_9HYPO|nr:hypothetical protein NW762_011153 [Fusarium torreyae]